jgi:Rrf2 family transcriptional regulator, iron-sulfur cluster assembly transcription factor
MFRLPKKLLFAIEAVLDIAYNAGDSPVQSAEITRRQGIPRRYLEQVLQQLVRVEILAGVRGPRGGYRLARERRRITLGEIVCAIRALENAADPEEALPGSPLGQAVVRPIWQEMQEDAMRRLDELTIEDLCNRAREQGIRRDRVAPADFSI